jgi:WD40 repeat protein
LQLQHAHGVALVAFSPDGQALATSGYRDKIARIWDAATGEQRQQLQHETAVTDVAFSPAGRLLATSSGSSITFWSIR